MKLKKKIIMGGETQVEVSNLLGILRIKDRYIIVI